MKKINWHAGFVPAMKLELLDNEDDLVFEEEHPVDKRGNWIDLLIIRYDKKVKISSKIGEIFDKYNIFEYKSPEDTADLGSFYKTLAYTSLYLKERHEYDKYGSSAFTMNIVCSHKPGKMMKQLKRDGIECTETAIKGIYRISGRIPFSAQIIITSQIPKECPWLNLLTKNATEEKVSNLVDNTKRLTDGKYREYANDVASIFFLANQTYFESIQEDKNNMNNKVWNEIFAEQHKKELAEKDEIIAKKDKALEKKEKTIAKNKSEIAKLKKQIAALQSKVGVL